MATKIPEQTKWLVIIEPVWPTGTGISFGNATYSTQPQKTVKVVEAVDAVAAAEKADPPAGATVHVAPMEHVSKFVRPAKAKLEAA